MANVDMATRILNFVSSDKYKSLNHTQKTNTVFKFYRLTTRQKPISFREASQEELFVFFDNLNDEVRKKISDIHKTVNFSLEEESDDNKVGADLLIKSNLPNLNNTRIELKFGSETNRNIGNNTMDEVFSVKNQLKYFTDTFREIRVKQQRFVSESKEKLNDEVIDDNLNKVLLDIVERMSNLYNDSDIVVDSEKMAQLLLATGSIDNLDENSELLKMNVKFTSNIDDAVNLIDLPNVTGDWKIKSIEMAPNSTRIVIWTENKFIRTKFLLNWKNNKTFNGKKYAAKLGLGSSSWNVWVYM